MQDCPAQRLKGGLPSCDVDLPGCVQGGQGFEIGDADLRAGEGRASGDVRSPVAGDVKRSAPGCEARPSIRPTGALSGRAPGGSMDVTGNRFAEHRLVDPVSVAHSAEVEVPSVRLLPYLQQADFSELARAAGPSVV